METKIVKFVSNFCASVLAAVVIVMTVKSCVDVLNAFVFPYRDDGVLYETTLRAWGWNLGLTFIAALALRLLKIQREKKADIVGRCGMLGMLAAFFFTGALIAALLNNGSYIKALIMGWVMCAHICALIFVTRGWTMNLRDEVPKITDVVS